MVSGGDGAALLRVLLDTREALHSVVQGFGFVGGRRGFACKRQFRCGQGARGPVFGGFPTAFCDQQAHVSGRGINRRRTRYRFASANAVNRRAVFFAKPR